MASSYVTVVGNATLFPILVLQKLRMKQILVSSGYDNELLTGIRPAGREPSRYLACISSEAMCYLAAEQRHMEYTWSISSGFRERESSTTLCLYLHTMEAVPSNIYHVNEDMNRARQLCNWLSSLSP